MPCKKSRLDASGEEALARRIYDEIQEVMPLQGSLSVERMCQLTGVSRAGFYRSLQERTGVLGLAGFLEFAVVSIELFLNLFLSFVWIETFRFELEVAASTDRKFPQAVLHDPELPLCRIPHLPLIRAFVSVNTPSIA